MNDAYSSVAEPRDATHEPPKITRLGTLAELTLGSTIGPADGIDGENIKFSI